MRILLLGALCALLVLPAWGGRDPALRVVDRTPLTVVGTGFAAAETVTLTLRAGRSRPATRTVRAGGDGRFRAAFGGLILVEPCRGVLFVGASGSSGSRATWKRVCRPPSTRPPRVSG